MSECVHCHAEVGSRRWFDMPMCEVCELVQREALSRIAQLVRPVKWSASPELLEE
jgi:hypothetical protein